MSIPAILLILLSAVALLLFMVLRLKISAFISLLVPAIYVGIAAGMPLREVLKAIEEGMAGTLGFVATVVGLGAIFGQILESSGGAQSLAHHLIRSFGIRRAPWAMTLTGFLVAIPVFFDWASSSWYPSSMPCRATANDRSSTTPSPCWQGWRSPTASYPPHRGPWR